MPNAQCCQEEALERLEPMRKSISANQTCPVCDAKSYCLHQKFVGKLAGISAFYFEIDVFLWILPTNNPVFHWDQTFASFPSQRFVCFDHEEKGINDYQQNHEVSPSIFQQNEAIQRKHRAQVFFLCGKQHCVRRIEATLLNCSDIKWRTKLMFALGKAGGVCSAFTIYQTILNRYIESYLLEIVTYWNILYIHIIHNIYIVYYIYII